MNDAPRGPTRAWRPNVEDYEAASGALEARGHSMTGLLNAVLRWFNHHPEAALATLNPHWPEPRRIGRPRLPSADQPASSDAE